MKNNITVHKKNPADGQPKVSLILLDWSCRESFHSFYWLSNQNVSRDQYELIWVELFDRVVPQALEYADTVITCGQKDLYHKHVGYNIGFLQSRGEIITICDSDAVFPPDFIDSILDSFKLTHKNEPIPLMLMHYEWRTAARYPKNLTDIIDLKNYDWLDLWPNVGACMSIRRTDLVRYGGFDEHRSFRGYLCGPYDLGWRLINAGIPEVWHDEQTALWHFAHPDPPGTFDQSFSLKLWREKSYPHVDHHALMAVEAFSTGRLLPLKENPDIHQLRMAQRRIGTKFEEKYALMTGPRGFSRLKILKLNISFMLEPVIRILVTVLIKRVLKVLEDAIGSQKYLQLRNWWRSMRGKEPIKKTS